MSLQRVGEVPEPVHGEGRPVPKVGLTEDPVASQLLDDLGENLESLGFAPHVAAHLYERVLQRAVSEIAARRPELSVADPPAPSTRASQSSPDFIVATPRGVILGDAKFTARAAMNTAMLRNGLATVRRHLGEAPADSLGGLLVINVPVARSRVTEPIADPRVRVVTWAGPQDDAALEAALLNLFRADGDE